MGLGSALSFISLALLASAQGNISWVGCGANLQCADVSVPLDYNNATDDSRTLSIGVTRFLATDAANRQGSIYINPGGPGNSGAALVYSAGQALSVVFNGQFDIVGIDPRGVNRSMPMSCFDSLLLEDVFDFETFFELNVPVPNSTTDGNWKFDLLRQVKTNVALAKSLGQACFEKMGETMAFFGTEAVVKDFDFIARRIDGPDAPINYYGISYGSILGQYMLQILPPERIGRVIMDGIVDAESWSGPPTNALTTILFEAGPAISAFAEACTDVSTPGCALGQSTPQQILSGIDKVVNGLYDQPIPVFGLPVPMMVSATLVRQAVQAALYNIASWPRLAELLASAMSPSPNFTAAIEILGPPVPSADSGRTHDDDHFAQMVIWCCDSEDYTSSSPAPTDEQLTQLVINSLDTIAPRSGPPGFMDSLCHTFPSLSPRKSRYAGGFSLANGTLHTPVLILANELDPVTPLVNAQHTNDLLGSNARLIEQRGGIGHTAISAASYCTASLARAYMVHGDVPQNRTGFCDVDQKPFLGVNDTKVLSRPGVDQELWEAWKALGAITIIL